MLSRGSRLGTSGIAQTALLMGLAATLGYVESAMLPSLPIPGLKVGLANIAIVVALLTLGRSRALAVSLGRVVLVGLATGMIAGPTAALSAGGALASWGVMASVVGERTPFSIVGISLAGSSASAIAQLLVAALVTGSAAPLMLLPLSLGLSIPAGLAVGLAARLLISRVPRTALSTAG
jgi:heptaprenyl diphosphate synthase